MESHFEAMEEDDCETDVVVHQGEGPDSRNTIQRWARPDLPAMNPKTDAVVFQQLDVDHYSGQPMVGMPGAQVSLLRSFFGIQSSIDSF